MKRFATVFAVCCAVGWSGMFGTLRAQTPEELSQTASLAASFQNPDGGFAGQSGGASSLGATSANIRILGYTGGAIPDPLGAIRYVQSCFNPDSGGFSSTPGGKPDVGTTATGLMVSYELKILEPVTVKAALKYLADNAKTFEEVRIAVAGFEAAKATPSEPSKWKAIITEGENPDGTFGQGINLARDTGGKAVALLRMGLTLEHRDAIVAALKAAQRPDGAWAKSDSGSDLEATYRIMRCLFMLKETPDLGRLNAFLASCRRADGSFGIKPGDTSGNATYSGAIISYWARLLAGEPAITETAGFVPLFNGQNLDTWEGSKELWSVRDGVLTGHSNGLDHNEFLANRAIIGSASVKLQFRIIDGHGNSGVQFRSVRVPGTEMSGYQADLGEKYWGCLYDESRRNKVLVTASEAALKGLNKTAWNEYDIDTKGSRIKLRLNGVTSVEYNETDPGIAREGQIAVQLHRGDAMEAQFKQIRVQPYPEPVETSAKGPGWHLRTLKRAGQDRKYSLYVPKEYDGQTPLPVVLFLHGSGERGKDGILPTQAGIGPAILKSPDSFPAIVIFPQATKTWKAGSPDAADALAALDEVLSEWKSDPRRVILTGLSMGGEGSWLIGARYPERFAAVIPVCGRGKPDLAATLAKRPVWTVIGDLDKLEPLLETRAMVQALIDAGAKPRYTEYRSVPHNSWDRAYNNPDLIAWMLKQSQ